MQNEIYDKKNGITYMLCGDYYLPELTLADTEPTYEKHEQPLEVVAKHIIQTKFIAPKERPYQTQNLYAVLERQRKLEKEVSEIAKGTYKKGSGKKKRRG